MIMQLREADNVLEEFRSQLNEKEELKKRLQQQMAESKLDATQLENNCIQIQSKIIDLKKKIGFEENIYQEI